MKLLSCLVVMIMLSSCGKEVLLPEAYMAWVKSEDNGLRVKKEIGGHIFELQYKPTAYEILLHQKPEEVTQHNFEEGQIHTEGLQYFMLTIIANDKMELPASQRADETQFGERVNYMMSEMQYDFALIDGSDTLPCVFYHFERNFNLSPENNILLGFEKNTKAGELICDKTLYYTDHLLDCGPVLIKIKAEDIENIPELKFQE